MTVFGYDWFADHARAAKIATPKLLQEGAIPAAPRAPETGGAEDYAYEILNFADGRRTVQQIRDAVSAEYGPIDADVVAEYLRALAAIGVLERTGSSAPGP